MIAIATTRHVSFLLLLQELSFSLSNLHIQLGPILRTMSAELFIIDIIQPVPAAIFLIKPWYGVTQLHRLIAKEL